MNAWSRRAVLLFLLLVLVSECAACAVSPASPLVRDVVLLSCVGPADITMAPPKVTLYSHRFCPYTNVVQLALAYTDTAYTWEQLDPPANPADKERVLALNKDGTVPVVDWDGLIITSADVLLNHLEPPAADNGGTKRKKKAKETTVRKKTKVAPPSLWMLGEADRATVQQWVNFARDELAGPLMKVLMASAQPMYVRPSVALPPTPPGGARGGHPSLRPTMCVRVYVCMLMPLCVWMRTRRSVGLGHTGSRRIGPSWRRR
jgi:hypothetical protein